MFPPNSHAAAKEGDKSKQNQLSEKTNAVVELGDEDNEADEADQLEKLKETDAKREDVKRIRGKALMRRAKGKMELGGWANLQGAEADYKELLQLKMLPRSEELGVISALRELPEKINVAKEKEVGDMMEKLKEVCPLGSGLNVSYVFRIYADYRFCFSLVMGF